MTAQRAAAAFAMLAMACSACEPDAVGSGSPGAGAGGASGSAVGDGNSSDGDEPTADAGGGTGAAADAGATTADASGADATDASAADAAALDSQDSSIDLGPCDNGVTTACEPKRKKLTIQGSQVPSAQTDFPVLVSISTDSDLAFYADPAGLDIYFTDSDGSTLLPFERESYSTNGTLVAWVQLDLTGNNQDFYLYYGSGERSEKSAPASVWTNAFAAVYHFDAPASGTQPDSTSNGNSASPDTGNCSSAAPVDQPNGHIAGALTFGGNSCDRLIASDSNSLDITNELTISAWVRPTTASDPAAGAVAAKRVRTQETANYHVGVGPDHNMRFMWGTGNMWPPVYASAPPAVPTTNQWSLLVWTVQGSPKAMRTYIDGVRINSSDQNLSSDIGGSYPVGTQLQLNANTQPLFLGGMDQETDEVFVGDLDEIHIIATSRSADWIMTEFNNQKSASTFLTLGAEEAL